MQVVHWAIIVHTGSRTRPPASAHSAALGSRFSDTQPLHRITHSTGLLASQDYSLSHSHSHFTGLLTPQDYSLHRITHSATHTATSQDHSLTEPFHRITHSHSHFTGLPVHSLTQPLHRITHSLTHTATSQDYSLTHRTGMPGGSDSQSKVRTLTQTAILDGNGHKSKETYEA